MEEGLGDEKMKRVGTLESNVSHKLCLMPSKLIRKYSILYTGFLKGKEVSRKLIKQCGTRGHSVSQEHHRVSTHVSWTDNHSTVQ